MRTSISGWAAWKPTSRGTSHLAPKEGATLTVSTASLTSEARTLAGAAQVLEALLQVGQSELRGLGQHELARAGRRNSFCPIVSSSALT